MKTSKYIFIAFLVFIFTTILTLFVSSKLIKDEAQSFQTLEEKLDSFSVIVAEKGAGFSLTSDSVFYMKITMYQEDSSLRFPDYKINNDTLFVSQSDQRFPTIHCKPLKAVVGKNESKIYFRDYYADSIVLNTTNSHVYGSFNWHTLKDVQVQATQNSDISLYQLKINSANISLDQSKANIYNNRIKQLNAFIENRSDLQVSHVGRINFDTDSTSTYNMSKR